MQKLNLQTENLAEEKLAALAAMFPGVVTETIVTNEAGESETVHAIDAAKLQEEINTRVLESNEQRYQFTWPDKRKAAHLANEPINKTLRPCREESVNFDSTENLYIEGDNLDVLKLLRETYLGKVKMIYIDPPYNTGNDFVYEDDFAMDREDWNEVSGDYDEQGNRLVKNLESNGRFHTDWLNMIYPRLRLARDLLTDDGVIFISIDDGEVENLKKVCNEVFGEGNLLGHLVWKKKYTGGKNTSTFADYHEYILCYAKHIASMSDISMERPDDEKGKFDLDDEYLSERGKYYIRPLKSNLDPRPTLVYPIELPDGSSIETQWICAKSTYARLVQEGRILLKKKRDGNYQVYKKFYENDGDGRVKIPSFLEISSNNDAKEELKKLFNVIQTRDLPFQTPKPVKLLSFLCQNFTDTDSTILDFFSGSASTAHAVMQLNAEDGGNRKFIMVQIAEETDEKSEAYKAGYKNICEIGKERIRRAGKKLSVDSGESIVDSPKLIDDKELSTKNYPLSTDFGFRVLKLDDSNMKDVYYSPKEYAQGELNLDDLVDNIKADRSDEDLLFQVMLDLGIELSAKITRDKRGVLYVDDTYLIACFGEATMDIVTDIAKRKPQFAIFRDSSFDKDSTLVNFEQVFRTYSPETERRVV